MKPLKTLVAVFTFALSTAFAQDIVIPYNAPAQWANWGEVLETFTQETGIEAPTDPKNSGQTLAALQAEAANPQADTALLRHRFRHPSRRGGRSRGVSARGVRGHPRFFEKP